MINASVSKINRIENGSVPVSITDLKALLDFYAVTDAETEASLIAAARASKARPWWHKYRELVRSQLPQLLAFEAEAWRIRIYHPYLITGLLQSAEYARELRSQTIKDESEIEQLVSFTRERQEILTGPEAPESVFVVDAASLRRKVGGPVRGPRLMAEQLRHLKALAALPNVSLRILHEDAGAHPAMNGPLTLFDCVDDDDPVLFIEGVLGDVLNQSDIELVKRFSEKFDVLLGLALSEADSAALLDELIDEYERAAAN